MGTKQRPIEAWYFMQPDRKLRYGDNRLVVAGDTHTTDRSKALKCCEHGLHASKRAIDALGYAPGTHVARVRLYPPFDKQDDKLCAYRREYLWVADATDVLRAFARWCALEVIHLCDAPTVVLEYLETGDESKREAAYAAARAAVRSAAGSAADAATRSAAWSAAYAAADATTRSAAYAAAYAAADATTRSAAWSAAYAAAYAAAWSARDAARSAWSAAAEAAARSARDAARDAQNRKLEGMLKELSHKVVGAFLDSSGGIDDGN